MIFISRTLLAIGVFFMGSCASMPVPKHSRVEFPKNAYLNEPKRPYEKIGVVRTRTEYPIVSADDDEATLCKNYFNASARKLVELAKDQGGDAVIQVRSVVYLLSGKSEAHPRAECAEENGEGQNLAMGFAIKWKPEPKNEIKP